ncbi:MAG: GerMN domain-containing protein [Bacillota bacterium]
MDINRKIVVVSIVIIIVLLALFGTLRIINQKSQPNELIKEMEISVYFATQEAMFLAPEKRVIDTENLYQNAINELIVGPSDPVNSQTIPDEVELKDIEIVNGEARVNFNRALIDNHWGGSTGERMTVYSIVNTLTQFEEIEEVTLLIEGEEVNTLVGHMDLTKPLTWNEKIIKE